MIILAQITNSIPDTLATDLLKVAQDLHINISIGTIAIIICSVKAIAGYIRNYALKNSTKENAGIVAKTIAHVAGNSLPSSTTKLVPTITN